MPHAHPQLSAKTLVPTWGKVPTLQTAPPAATQKSPTSAHCHHSAPRSHPRQSQQCLLGHGLIPCHPVPPPGAHPLQPQPAIPLADGTYTGCLQHIAPAALKAIPTFALPELALYISLSKNALLGLMPGLIFTPHCPVSVSRATHSPCVCLKDDKADSAVRGHSNDHSYIFTQVTTVAI